MAQAQVQTVQLAGGPVELEYRLAPDMVVFSHGFGVGRDAMGMFTSIVDGLPDECGYVLFGFNEIENGMTRLSSIEKQVERLRQVIAWTRAQAGVKRLMIVAHSKGCTIAALVMPENVHSVILLAPPLHIGSGLRQRFTTRPGTVRRGSTWIVPRSDGSTSLIDDAVFDEMDTIDGEKVITAYARKQPLYIIAAGDDGVLPGQDYSRVAAIPGTTFTLIENASHNFDGVSRKTLVAKVREYVTEAFRNK